MERRRCAFWRNAFSGLSGDAYFGMSRRKRSNGRRPDPTGKRVKLSNGPVTVSPQLKACLYAWRAAYGLPLGRSLDALFAHAVQSKGAFLFKLPLDGARESLKGYIPTKFKP
jgi:hypothetical protein